LEEMVMVQDYTKIGIQPEPAEEPDPLTELIRAGSSQQPGLGMAVKKLTGEVPMGADAPSKGLRKGITGAWELLSVVKYGFGTVFFLLFGGVFTYFGVVPAFAPTLFAFGIGGLALSALSARWTLHAARNLRSIARA
jgi:hypothetical protein